MSGGSIHSHNSSAALPKSSHNVDTNTILDDHIKEDKSSIQQQSSSSSDNNINNNQSAHNIAVDAVDSHATIKQDFTKAADELSQETSPSPSENLHESQAITAAASSSTSSMAKETAPDGKKPTILTPLTPSPGTIPRALTLDSPSSKWRSWTYGTKHIPEITIRRSIFFAVWVAIHVIILVVRIYEFPTKNKGFRMATRGGLMVCLITIYTCMSPTFLYLLNRKILPRFITFEKNIHVHKVAAYTLVVWLIGHIIIYYHKYIKQYLDQDKKPPKPGKKRETLAYLLIGKQSGWSGHLILLFFILMFCTSIWIVRRRRFELFYYVHQLHIPISVILFIHGKNEEFYKFLSGPLAVYVVDRLYRLIRGYIGHTNITAVIQHPSNVFELRIRKRFMFKARPGQYIRINCPTVAPLQWHPFTLTSAPEEDEMSVHIKVVGDWTNELSKVVGCDFNITKSLSSLSLNEMYDTDAIYNPKLTTIDYVEEESGDNRNKTSVKVTVPKLSGFEESDMRKSYFSRCKGFVKSIREVEEGGIKRSNTVLSTAKTDFKPTAFDNELGTFDNVVIPKIFVDGSYVAPAGDVFNYKITVMIGAGIGVTPFSSVLRSIRCRLRQNPEKLKMQKVYFFWVCRDMRSFEWFKELLVSLEKEGLSNLIEFRTFFTGPIPQDNDGKTGAPTLATTENDPYGSLKIANTIGGQTYIGRPHFESLVGYIGSQHPNSRLGVFYCGPKTLRAELRVITHRWSSQLNTSQNTKIDFHAEHF
ncbi:hypothetical protein H4219_006072 [Mycoemilia scoparia]|uniref:FAD-binding FR-type domain-containing protein n=1 Tax=Mycoemilia scoparia TaxID=417184 RepID=A0A9W8DMW1_9FUNG|nr:hypothetical protein H4219_006072 [Mycoemilia scoparia]